MIKKHIKTICTDYINEGQHKFEPRKSTHAAATALPKHKQNTDTRKENGYWLS